MQPFSHTRDIFEQLADTDGATGVRTIIENHDAWLNNSAVQHHINAAIRTQLARSARAEIVTRRIELQRQRLQALITRLPIRLSSAS
ncbi:MAG TPA: hypothetical protein VM008_21280 [Phycisphaerae bacterium]|nr:hypothetical protein [Phycisphaerae bacterium]